MILLPTLIFTVADTYCKRLKDFLTYSVCSRISPACDLHSLLLAPSTTDTARGNNSITSDLREHMFCQFALFLLSVECLLNEPGDNFLQPPSFLILYTVPSLKISPFL